SERATNVLFEALAASGLRAVAGLTLMDQHCPEALRVPRAEAMAACDRLAEQPDEADAVLAAHPIADDYLGVYQAVGLLGPRTIFAHAIHLSSSAWDRIAGAGASIAHCPDSNFFLGSGRMSLADVRSRHVRVGLGSDVAAGRSFDMRRAMAYAYDNALCLGERPSAGELFTLATLGGAAALHLDTEIGTLEPGKAADFVALELPAHATGQADVLAQIAFADAGRVTRAFVRGVE